MENYLLTRNDRMARIILAIGFITIGFIIIYVFSPLRPLLEKLFDDQGRRYDYLGRIGLIILLLAVVLIVSRSSKFQKYRPLWLGLLILCVAVSLDRIISVYVLSYLDVDGNTPAGYALLKLNECAVVFTVIILLTRLTGNNLGSIYLQRGDLKQGLSIGITAFVIAAAGSVPLANLMFKGHDLTLTRVISWLPWVLIFVLANASQEELLFRGLFLRKLEPFYGKLLSNLMIILVFTVLHQGASYASNDWMFLAAVLPLAFFWGWIMQKTDGIWGSILFHAGADIPILLGIFSNL